MKNKSLKSPRRGPKGRQVDATALSQVQALLADAPRDASLLIEFLHRIQDAYRQISAEHMVALAQELKLAHAEVYEVATFYHHFDVVRTPDAVAPDLTIRVCDGLSCEMAGARVLLEQLQAKYRFPIRVISAPCIGRCEAAPAVCVGQNAFGPASAAAVIAAVDANQVTAPVLTPDPAHFLASAYTALTRCLSGQLPLAALLASMNEAGLRGLGGAGFPTGRKWSIVRAAQGTRLMAVNIDEGEPGTFKDRWYLERNPQPFLEGMLIAAWAADVSEIYVYLRDEYHAIRALLEREIAALPAHLAALLAQHGWALPRIHLRRGAGAYICGEESAMIESIEGKRGLPRLRPPYVAEVGLFDRPTLVHNMETLYWVPHILTHGHAGFAGHGRRERKGLRSFSVSGRVVRPGVHLAPSGISVTELIDEYCGGMLLGHTLYAYLPGGASGGILPASLAHLPLDFDTLQPHGCFIGSAAVVVLSQLDRARDAARNTLEFFKHESCGQCTPCRAGTEKATHLLAQHSWDGALLTELGQVMQDASICGLGQAAPNPFLSVLKYFPHEVK
jgi:formate dehydrogenase